MNYIYNKESGKITSRCEYTPNIEDLESRGEGFFAQVGHIDFEKYTYNPETGLVPIPEVPKTPVELFKPDLAIAREAQVFNEDEMDRFSSVSYMVNELIRYKNFWGGTLPGDVTYVGLKQMAEKFIASGKITRSDYDKLNSILKEQNIDLDVPQ